MKNIFKKLFIYTLIIILGLSLLSCGDNGSTDDPNRKEDDNKEVVIKTEEIKFTDSTDVEEIKSQAEKEYVNIINEVKNNLTEEQLDVIEVKYQEVLTKIESLNGTIDSVKKELNVYYKEIKNTIDLVKKTVNTFNEKKEKTLSELKSMYDSICAVANPTTLEYVKELYNSACDEINNLKDESETKLKEICKAFSTAAKEYVTTVVTDSLIEIINEGRKELKKLADAGIAKIKKESLKVKVQELYNDLDLKIAGIIDSKLSKELVKQYLDEFSTKLLDVLKEEAESSIDSYKKLAIEKITELYNQYKDKITEEVIQKTFKDFYESIIKNITNCNTIEDVKAIYDDLETTVKDYIKTDLIKNIISTYKTKLQNLIKEQTDKITDKELEKTISGLVNTELNKLDGVTDLDDLKEKFESLKKTLPEDIKAAILKYAESSIDSYKTLAIDKLTGLYNQYKDKITEEVIQKTFKDFYESIITNINKCNTIDDVKTIYDNLETTVKDYIKTDLIENIISAYKTKLQDLVKDQIDKIPYEELEKTIADLVTTELNKLDGITDLDDLKEKFESLKKTLPEDIKAVVLKHAEGLLTEAKTLAKGYVDTLVNNVINKIEDSSVKTKINNAKTKAYNAIDKTKDTESYQEAIDEIKKDFEETLAGIISDLIAKLIKTVIEEGTKAYNFVYTRISETSQKVYKTLYDNYQLALSKINDIEQAATEATNLTTTFIDNSKNYIAEALQTVKKAAIDKVDEKYDEYLSTIDIKEYQTSLGNLYTSFKNAVNALSDRDTIVEDASKLVTDSLEELATEFKKYLSAKAELLKTETLAKGKTLYDGVYLKEEYTSKGLAARLVAKASIEAAYTAFKTAVENLTPAVGAKTVCDEAYEKLEAAFNKALGITTETE